MIFYESDYIIGFLHKSELYTSYAIASWCQFTLFSRVCIFHFNLYLYKKNIDKLNTKIIKKLKDSLLN